MTSIDYTPDGAVLKAFFKSNKFVRGIRGPIGSGTSTACCMEIMRRATQQAVGKNSKKRMTRWAVIRNTNPMLKTTTIKTWLEWFPEDVFGRFNWTPPYTHRIRMGDVDMEVLFLSLDRPEDIRKLLSLEITGFWANEARELPKSIIDTATSRCRRYPSMRDGGPTWTGGIMDTNAPDPEHWWPIMAGEAPPPEWMSKDDLKTLLNQKDWEFFCQPPAMLETIDSAGNVAGYHMNPKCENQANLQDGYYQTLIQGKTRSWIQIYVLNELVSLEEGKPVIPEFNRAVHVAKERFGAVEGVTVHIGLDFGLSPAAIFKQQVRGQWRVFHEILGTDMSTKQFAQVLKRDIATEVTPHKCRIVLTGDPAGDSRSPQADNMTSYQILESEGLHAQPAFTNSIDVRIEAQKAPFKRMVDGDPGCIVSPHCVRYVHAMNGGYHYKLIAVSGREVHQEVPNKNPSSHIADADQYANLGAGEGPKVLAPEGRSREATVVKSEFSVWDRHRNKRRRSGGVQSRYRARGF